MGVWANAGGCGREAAAGESWLGEGNWGVGSGVADYVFSHEDAYPEQVYLAPQTGEDSADMAWAIPLPVRE